MDFILDPEWQMLLVVALFAWAFLLFREVYRFRTLVSQFRILILGLGLLAVICWVSLFFLMLLRTGVLSAISSYALFLVLTPIILRCAKGRRSLLFHPESIAQHDWERATHGAIIEKTISRQDIQEVLSEYGQTPAFLRARMEQLIAMGHDSLLSRLGHVPNLRVILGIYARKDWTDLAKIIATINHLLRAH